MRPLTVDQLEQQMRTAMHTDDWATVADLEPRIDAATPPRQPISVVSAALWYASIGLHIFPLQAGAKIPHRGTRGCKDAATDPDQIIEWWRRWPDSNVAIATGHLVDVIDIDGPEGVTSWARTTNLPAVLGTVNTPRAGGTHLYVAASGEGNAAGIFPGVDIRGLGGYCVAPPSYVITDNYSGRYTWRRPLSVTPAAVAA